MGTQNKVAKAKFITGLEKFIHQFKENNNKVTRLYLHHGLQYLRAQGEKWWDMKINLAAPDEHFPDAEQNN